MSQSGTPEYLDSHGGRPLDRETPQPQRRRRRKPLLLAGAGVLGVGLVGGAAGAAWWFYADGPQAAEALPASAIGYVGLTLDPSGGQQLEALRTLEKFPALSEELDLEGDVQDIDVKEALGTALLDSAPCDDLSYDDDLRPWLGDRAGVAALLVDDAPQPLVALESTDDAAAEDALGDLVGCAAGAEPESVFEVRDGWALVAPDQDVLDQALADLEDGTLAEDADFTRWSEEAGDPGIVTMYAAPEAGTVLLDLVESASAPAYAVESASDGMTSSYAASTELPEELQQAFEDFEGAGAQLRFRDGGLELEVAGSAGEGEWSEALSGGAGDLVAGLPAGTGLVYAYGLGESWVEPLFAYLESDPTMGMVEGDLEELLRSELGLEGSDLEDALGDSAALVVGSDIDIDAVQIGDFSSIPVAVVSTGEEAALQRVVDALNPLLGPGADLLAVSAGEGRVAMGTDSSWTEEVAEGGDLGESDAVRDVLPDLAGSTAVSFIDFDAVTEVVVELMESLGEDPTEVEENLEPLSAFGTSSHVDDDGIVRGLVRLSTD